jgi:hypothetical protein
MNVILCDYDLVKVLKSIFATNFSWAGLDSFREYLPAHSPISSYYTPYSHQSRKANER